MKRQEAIDLLIGLHKNEIENTLFKSTKKKFNNYVAEHNPKKNSELIRLAENAVDFDGFYYLKNV